MASCTLKMVFSKSVATEEDLREAKMALWQMFEEERGKVNPKEFIVIVDGQAFPIKSEEEYDEFTLRLRIYSKVRRALEKIVTITVFQE